MIGSIDGIVAAKRAGFVIISASGIGYKVAATRETLAKLKEKESTLLWTHLAVRENSLDLYGFKSEEELQFFELLLTVPGIGPKSALAVLDVSPLSTLRNAIASENATYLTNVSGIGKKTAEKIVLELRDKVGKETEGSVRSLSADEEALQAMRALGYTHSEARDVLRKVPSEIESGSARLREALRILGSR